VLVVGEPVEHHGPQLGAARNGLGGQQEGHDVEHGEPVGSAVAPVDGGHHPAVVVGEDVVGGVVAVAPPGGDERAAQLLGQRSAERIDRGLLRFGVLRMDARVRRSRTASFRARTGRS